MSRFIAAITANAFSKDIMNTVGNGMNNHPLKPIDIKVL